jgi:Ca2+-binding RTX toxin-like protein
MQPHLTHLLAIERRRILTNQAGRARALAPRRRIRRRAVLTAVLAIAAGTLAIPAIANASTATVVGTELQIERGSAVDNAMTISVQRDGRVLVTDSREAISPGAGCSSAPGGVLCFSTNRIAVAPGAGNDTLTNTGSLPTRYLAGPGDDVLAIGTALGASQVTFDGGDGRDTVSYAAAGRGVTVTLDAFANDGRTGADQDNIGDDVEVLQGSPFADTLQGSREAHRFVGLAGDDQLRGGVGNDIFHMGATADGADRIDGGSGFDTVDYRTRTRAVTVTVDARGSDDGEAGERDQVDSMEQVLTGSGADTLTGSPAATRDASFVSGAGVDTITGTDQRDTITPGAGRDTVDARGGADLVRARDGESDTIACGAALDTLQADAGLELSSGCETVERIGVLRLASKAIDAKAGKAAAVTLSWRHPDAWRKLRTVTLRLTNQGVAVGEVTVHPRSERIEAAGVVKVARRAARLTRRGKTVTARLALRIDASMTGQSLGLEVEATDKHGRRQLERDAGTIRVAK